MSYEIQFENLPAGYAINAARKVEDVTIESVGFVSTEDGQDFIAKLEGFPNDVLKLIVPQSHCEPSQIDNLLVIVRRDRTATVYVNEVKSSVKAVISRAVDKGTTVMKSDLVDIQEFDFGIEVPRDAGFLFLFSIRWRKGLFFDFLPLSPSEPQARTYDVNSALGQAYCYVMFQERFTISDNEWDTLFRHKWFPFAGLHHNTIDTVMGYIRAGWDPDELTNDIATEVKNRIPDMVVGWRTHPTFEPHIDIFERAAERFQCNDYISCAALLFPRIEGLMRTHFDLRRVGVTPSSGNLPETAVMDKVGNPRCLLLPSKFHRYLREVFFASFNPTSNDNDVARHSVAHGVAAADKFNVKSALLGVLIVHQLFYCFERTKPDDSKEPS